MTPRHCRDAGPDPDNGRDTSVANDEEHAALKAVQYLFVAVIVLAALAVTAIHRAVER
ncbi:MAG: hypothetical protein R2722_11200 [Tessaracoccus sp.]